MPTAYHHGSLATAMSDAALAEVRARGPEGVSLRRIAQSLDVSPSAAYNHFADKDDLLAEVGRRGHDDLDERMATALARHPEDTDAAAVLRFRALGEAYLAFASEDPNLFRLTFSPRCFALPGEADGDEAGPFGRLRAALAELSARGLLRPGIEENLDVAVWSGVHGLSVLILEGAVPVEAGPDLLDTFGRLVTIDPPTGT